MPTVFLSYRRSDSSEEAKQIKTAMATRFGEDVVFRDEEAIPAGTDFREAIAAALGDCVAMLVVIGPDWLTAKSDSGERRLDNTRDFVHIEIAKALSRSIPVVPVLVRNATIPSPEELPESLKGLATRNAIKFDVQSEDSVDRLCDDLTIQLWVRHDLIESGNDESEYRIYRSAHGLTEIPPRCSLTCKESEWVVAAVAANNRLDGSGCGCFFYAFVVYLLVDVVKELFRRWHVQTPPDENKASTFFYVIVFLLLAAFLWSNFKFLLSNSTVRIVKGHVEILEGIPMLRRRRQFELHSLLRLQVEMASLALVVSNDGFYRKVTFGSELPPKRRFFVMTALRRRLRELSRESSPKPSVPKME